MERLLLLAGLVGIGVWAWSHARTSVYQDWQNWAFDQRVKGQQPTIGHYLSERIGRVTAATRAWLKMPSATNPPAAPPEKAIQAEQPRPASPPELSPPEKNSVLGRLAIPRLHMNAMVREGVGDDTLNVALGHIPSTALPGQEGNIGVAGHRDTLFRGLRNIKVNDQIRFETLGGNHVYQVEGTRIVKPEDVGVLKAGLYPELTLVTCYPFYYVGSAPDRFIVKAREVSLAKGRVADPPAAKLTEVAQAAESRPVAEHKTPAAKERRPPAEVRAFSTARADRDSNARTERFEVLRSHSRQLAPGISMGLTETDAAGRRMDGWMWVMPERRTIWLRGQLAHQPVVFYRDGRRRELVITKVSANSVSGSLR